MTIQAYQTLYESSIAYGMRKALQAEQSKAEMLIKIQNIEDECAELEEEVEDQKRKIKRMLQDEQNGKEDARLQHEEELNMISSGNQMISENLKTLLFTFTEVETKEEDE